MGAVFLKPMLIFMDVFSLSRHSRYFDQTRSHHLFLRVRLIALLLAILQSAWVLVDRLLLPDALQTPIALARVASSLALLLLVAWYRQPYNLRISLVRLGGLILILSAFQLSAQLLLLRGGYQQAVAGYQFFPFMIVATQAIFPLTIVEVVLVTLSIGLLMLATQLVSGQFGTLAAINDLWLLGVLAIIAGWASVNQLSMLLGLYRQATRDPLTGLANRRQVMEQLERDLALCDEKGQPLSVLLHDLDRFKGFNDNHGHAAGDIVLKRFARILRQQTGAREQAKQGALAGRFGGEEFLVILPGMDAEESSALAERIRSACHQAPVRIPSGEQVQFTVSTGVATVSAEESVSDLLRRADGALYAAKAQGRDRWVLAPAGVEVAFGEGAQPAGTG